MTQSIAESYAVLIPNWNGEAFIERCLGSVLAALRRAGLAADVLVVDDASEDRSPEIVARQYPGVRLTRLEQNLGFGRAVGRGMAELSADWVFLLNNDVAVRADFFSRLTETLREQEQTGARVLAIGGRTLDWETGAINHGGQRAARARGMIVQEAFESETAAGTDFFQAGACVLHRASFMALGGFPDLYHPGYWEDYDLAQHGAKRGLACFYEPRAIAWHCGKGSMRRRYGEEGVALMLRRNHLLFNWCNLPAGELVGHLLQLGPLVARGVRTGLRSAEDQEGAESWLWFRALLGAMGRLPAALCARRERAAERWAMTSRDPRKGSS